MCRSHVLMSCWLSNKLSSSGQSHWQVPHVPIVQAPELLEICLGEWVSSSSYMTWSCSIPVSYCHPSIHTHLVSLPRLSGGSIEVGLLHG